MYKESFLIELYPYDPSTASVRKFGFGYNLVDASIIGSDVPYLLRMDTSFSHEVKVYEDNIPSGTTFSYGSVSLKNADGLLNNLLSLEWASREIRIYRSTKGTQNFSDFDLYFVGSTLEITADYSGITISISEKADLIPLLLQQNTYAGSGGKEGFGDLRGAMKPLAFGLCLNASPVLLDPVKLIYQIHDGPITGIEGVYDRGNPLRFRRELNTYEELVIDNLKPSEGEYTYSKDGFIRLGAPPSSFVNVDVRGEFYNAVNLAETVKQIILSRTTLTLSDLDSSSFSSLSSKYPGRISGMYYKSIDVSFQEWLHNAISSIDALWYFDSDAKLKVKAFEFGTSVATFRDNNIDQLVLDFSPAPYKEVIVEYDRASEVNPSKDYVLAVAEIDLYANNSVIWMPTASDGSGGNFAGYAGKVEAVVNGEAVSSTEVVNFSCSATWLNLSPDGSFTITNPGIGEDYVYAIVYANVAEQQASLLIELSKVKTGTATTTLSATDHIFNYDPDGYPTPSNQSSVFTATLTNHTGTLTWKATDNLGNSVPLSISGNTATILASNIQNGPLSSHVDIQVNTSSGQFQKTRLILSRASTGYFNAFSNLLTISQGKVTMFYQEDAPTSGESSINDMWIDTNDGNRLRRWSGSAWLEVTDTRVVQALTDAAGAQGTADGKVATFIATSAPSPQSLGDLWYNPNNKELRRWDGSSWTTVSTLGATIGSNLILSSGSSPTQAQIVTSEGVAAAITGQGSGATANNLSQLNPSEGSKLTGIEAGATRQIPRGLYSNANTYSVGDIITWSSGSGGDGNTYIRIGSGTTIGTLPSDVTKWLIMVEAAEGSQGVPGFGAVSIPFAPGMVGGIGDFQYVLNSTNGSNLDPGELFITANNFRTPSGTLITKDTKSINGYITTPYENSFAAGNFFIMYTEEPSSTRWPTLSIGTVTNLVPIRINNGTWEVFGNSNSSFVFTPLSTDCIIASVGRTSTGTGTGLDTLFSYTNGFTTYNWIAYSNSDDGTKDFTTQSPGGRQYIGFAYNKSTPSEGSSPTDYEWSKYAGPGTFGLVTSTDILLEGDAVSKKTGTGNAWGQGFYSSESYTGGSVLTFKHMRPVGNFIGVMGLNDDPTTSSIQTNYTYKFYFNGTNVFSDIQDASSVDHGSYTNGDTWQISYKGTEVQFLKNGTVIRTVSGQLAGQTLYLDGAIHTADGRFYDIRFVPSGADGAAGVPGATKYTWRAFADTIDGTLNFTTGAVGTRTFIGEALNKDTAVESTNPADYTWAKYTGDPSFTLLAGANAVISGNKIIKTSASGSWNASGYSQEAFTGGAIVRFHVDKLADHVMIGLTTATPSSSNSWEDITYAWYIRNFGGQSTASIRSNGNGDLNGSFTFTPGPTAIFSVVYDGDKVRFYVNGQLHAQLAAARNLTMRMDCSMEAQNSTITVKDFSPNGEMGVAGPPLYTWWAYANSINGTLDFTTGEPAGRQYIGIATNKTTATESVNPADYQWTRYTGPSAWGLTANESKVAIIGNSVKKILNNTAWDAGFNSTQGFRSGGYVSWTLPTAFNNPYQVIIGLNEDPLVDESHEYINYAFYVFVNVNEWNYQTRLSNGSVISHGAISPGSKMSVQYSGTTVNFLVNDVIIRSVTVAADQMVYVDGSLAHPGNGVDNLTFSAVGPKGQAGDNGAPGATAGTVNIYTRDSFGPAAPSANLTYTFSNGSISGNLQTWSTSIPDANGLPLWVRTVTVNGIGTTTITQAMWGAAKKMAQDGAAGRPAVIYYQNGEPSGPVEGDTWVNLTTPKIFKVYNGGQWKQLLGNVSSLDIVTASYISVNQLSALSGSIGFLTSNPNGGARVEWTTETIRVFDSNNVERVRLGNLA